MLGYQHTNPPAGPGSFGDGGLEMSAVREHLVLVVDDDPGILEVVAEVLTFEGYPVETATNGAQALTALQQATPCAVILDMNMPVLDGWGFAAELKQRGLELPILVMTAAQSAQRCCEQLGAAGYLGKPFNILDLLAAVEQVCGPPE